MDVPGRPHAFICSLLFSLFILFSTAGAEDITGQLKLISTSSFIGTEKILQNSGGKEYAVLAVPSTLNQFLIIDMQKPVALSEVLFYISSDSGVAENELVFYSGQNILQWQRVTASISRSGDRYSMKLDTNSGQYVKLVFGMKSRGSSLNISSFSFERSDAQASQQIVNVRIPEETRGKKSVAIEYETVQPSITYLVYATNFDFIYTNKMDSVYSDLTPKTKHRVVLQGLTPKVTYAYQILAKDINEKQYQTRFLYFSTR